MNTHPLLPGQLPPRGSMAGSMRPQQPGSTGMGPMMGQQHVAQQGQPMPGMAGQGMPGQIPTSAPQGYAAQQRQLMNQYLQEQGKKFAAQTESKSGIFSRIFGGKKSDAPALEAPEKQGIVSNLFGFSKKSAGGEAPVGYYQQRSANYQVYRQHQRGIQEMQKEYLKNSEKMAKSSGHMQQTYMKRQKAMDKQMKREEKQLKKDYMNYRRPS